MLLRYHLRSLLSTPILNIVAVLSIGVGVGANTLVFSWLNGTVLHPFPGIRDPSRVVGLEVASPSGDGWPISFPTFRQWRDASTSIRSAAAWTLVRLSAREQGGSSGSSTPLVALSVSGNYFDVLGGRALIGRGVEPADEEERRPVVTLGFAYWQRQYAGSKDVIGRTLYLNGEPFEVVGVAPREFVGTYTGVIPDLFIPITLQPRLTSVDALQDRKARVFQAIARLADGVNIVDARREIDALARRLSSSAGERPVTGAIVKDIRTQYLGGLLLPLFGAMLATTALLLVVGCVNVAGLLLIHLGSKRHELAVRSALGASRGSLAFDVTIHCLLLVALGGAVALGIVYAGRGILYEFVPTESFALDLPITLDWRVFVFTFSALAFVVAVSAGAPALRSLRVPPAAAMQVSSRTIAAPRSRVRDAIVAGQLALSVVCLASAGLFVRGLRDASAVDLGFTDPEHVLLVNTNLDAAHLHDTVALGAIRSIIQQVSLLPGVRAASVSTFVPLGLGGRPISDLRVEGYAPQANEDVSAIHVSVGPGYHELLGTRIVAGRGIDARDREGTLPVVVVNETLARHFWPNENALGKRIDAGRGWATIVGVVHDGKYGSLVERPPSVAFFPIAQWYQPTFVIYARTAGEPRALAETVRRSLQSIHPDIPALQVRSLREHIGAATFVQRVGAWMLSVFGMIALAISIIGLYATLALTVLLRRRELGIRLVLGAPASSVLWLVVRHGLALTIAGTVVGVTLSVLASKLFLARIASVGVLDVESLSQVSVLMIVAAIGASVAPALRAVRTVPAATISD